jgi:hypothetical protein
LEPILLLQPAYRCSDCPYPAGSARACHYSSFQRKELFLGINSEASLVKQGKNNNLRVISYSDEK